MGTLATVGSSVLASPSPTKLRSMYETATRALLRNEPLRAQSSGSLQAEQGLAKGELAALHAVGLDTKPWPRVASAADPLARTVVDFMALIETSLGTNEAARMLRVDVSRIRQRLRERTLLGFEYEGEWRLPRFQFDRKLVLPGLGEVLGVIDVAANPLEVAEWFLTPNVDLEIDGQAASASPREWLLRGGVPSRVAALAREL